MDLVVRQGSVWYVSWLSKQGEYSFKEKLTFLALIYDFYQCAEKLLMVTL